MIKGSFHVILRTISTESQTAIRKTCFLYYDHYISLLWGMNALARKANLSNVFLSSMFRMVCPIGKETSVLGAKYLPLEKAPFSKAHVHRKKQADAKIYQAYLFPLRIDIKVQRVPVTWRSHHPSAPISTNTVLIILRFNNDLDIKGQIWQQLV